MAVRTIVSIELRRSGFMVQHTPPLARSVSAHIPKEQLLVVTHGTNAGGYTLLCTYLAQVGRVVSYAAVSAHIDFDIYVTTITTT